MTSRADSRREGGGIGMAEGLARLVGGVFVILDSLGVDIQCAH